MAIFKAVSHGKSSSMGNAIAYVQNASKTHGMSVGFGCSPDTALADMREVQRAWGKEGGTGYYHYLLSFAPGEVSAWEALDIAQELVKQLSPLIGHQVLLSAHSDREHEHVHIIVNAVSERDGRKLQFSPSDLAEAKRICNELTAARGLSVPEKGKTYDGQERDSVVSYQQDTYQRLAAAEDPKENAAKPSYVRDIGAAVVRAIASATSRKEFIAQLNAAGISTVWVEQRKHVTFTDRARAAAGEKQCKIRLGTLGKYYNLPDTKEALQHEFEANAERAAIAERVQNAAADGLVDIRESETVRRESEVARRESEAARGESIAAEQAPAREEITREAVRESIIGEQTHAREKATREPIGAILDGRLSETQVLPAPVAEEITDTEREVGESQTYGLAERIAAGIRAIARWAAETAVKIREAIDAGIARIRRQSDREVGHASAERASQLARTVTERAAGIARAVRDAIRDHWGRTRVRPGAVRATTAGRADVGSHELIEVPYSELVVAGQKAVCTPSGMRMALLHMALYPALRIRNIYALIGAEKLHAVSVLTCIQHGVEVPVPDAMAALPAVYIPTETIHAQLQHVAHRYDAPVNSKYCAMDILATATGDAITDDEIDQLVCDQIVDPMTLEHANIMWRQAINDDWREIYERAQRAHSHDDWER